MALSLLLLLEAVLVLVLLEAEAVDSDGGSGAAVSSREGGSSSSLVLRFLSLSSSSLVFFPPLFLSFGSLFFLSPFSLFWFFLFSSPLLCFFRFLPRPFSFPQRSWVLFIEPRAWLCTVEHGEQPAGRPLGAAAKARPPPPRFSGRCAVGGRPLCPVGGLQAREWSAKIQKKASLFLPPRCMFGGEEER